MFTNYSNFSTEPFNPNYAEILCFILEYADKLRLLIIYKYLLLYLFCLLNVF